jgi:non-specific serine/threonine protein kinase
MDTPSQQNLNQLPVGTVLGDFKITGVIGEGGFGIVYLAYEATLDRTVAIKEYLPSSIAGRTGNQSVMVRSQLNTNAFSSGLRNFLREAQLLARFSHPAMVEVHRVWEQNSTAYMAMRYYDGKTLRELRQGAPEFDETYIRRLVEPIFDALSLLHAQNVIHRDVSPDNILMRGNGKPVLLDLGAARLVIGGMTQALTTVLKPGYAPIEQYVDDGTMNQGPWTDVYGLGAVLYFLLTGGAPPQAVARMITDPLRTLATPDKIPVRPEFLEAVVKALAVRPDNRFQSVDELRDGLGWTEPLPIEPRTTFSRVDAATLAAGVASATAAAATAGRPTTQPQMPTAVVRPVTAPATPPPAAAPRTQPPAQPAPALDRVFAQDNDATVVWQPPANSPHPVTGSKPRPAPPPPPPVAPPLATTPPAQAPRAKQYGEASGSGNKIWIVAALGALVAAGGGYYFFGRGDKTPAPTPPVAVADSQVAPGNTPPPAPAPAPTPTPPSPAPAPAAPVAAPAPAPAPAAAIPVKPATETKKEPAKTESDETAAAKAKREAEEKTKARLEAQEKAAKAKSDAEERAKARAKTEAEERAAAIAKAEQDERARRARAEEEERQAAARKAEADRQAKAATANPPSGLVVVPPRRTVDELAVQARAAWRENRVSAARSAWNELVSHPDVSARDKAVAYFNLAVSYCQNGDEAACERSFLGMFRADRAYATSIPEREDAALKRAYDRAARTARALY